MSKKKRGGSPSIRTIRSLASLARDVMKPAWLTPEIVDVMVKANPQLVICALSLEMRAPGSSAWSMNLVVFEVLGLLQGSNAAVGERYIRESIADLLVDEHPEDLEFYVRVVGEELQSVGVEKIVVPAQGSPADGEVVFMLVDPKASAADGRDE